MAGELRHKALTDSVLNETNNWDALDTHYLTSGANNDIPVYDASNAKLVGKTPAQVLKILGAVHPLANTYISGSGTVGVDNTAQTVKTVVVPANCLTQVGDRLRIRSYWKGDTGGGVTGTTTLNTVTVAAATDGGGADFFTTEAWLHYLTNTTANIIETGAYPATGSNSAENVSGFTWDANQDVDVDQDQVGNNHIIVYCIFLDVYPKGVV